jgi:hypothetical protein
VRLAGSDADGYEQHSSFDSACRCLVTEPLSLENICRILGQHLIETGGVYVGGRDNRRARVCIAGNDELRWGCS